MEENKIFSQTKLYDISGVLKQTFVSELEKFTNIYSQFINFCRKETIKISSFTIDNTKIFFQLKNDCNGEKDLLLSKETKRIIGQTFF